MGALLPLKPRLQRTLWVWTEGSLEGKPPQGMLSPPGIGSVEGEAAALWLLPQRGVELCDWLWGLKEA